MLITWWLGRIGLIAQPPNVHAHTQARAHAGPSIEVEIVLYLYSWTIRLTITMRTHLCLIKYLCFIFLSYRNSYHIQLFFFFRLLVGTVSTRSSHNGSEINNDDVDNSNRMRNNKKPRPCTRVTATATIFLVHDWIFFFSVPLEYSPYRMHIWILSNWKL